MENKEQNNFFEKFGLEVASGEVEVGQTYPIYGMITKVLDDTPGSVCVEINFTIKAWEVEISKPQPRWLNQRQLRRELDQQAETESRN